MALVSSTNTLSTTAEVIHTAVNGSGHVPEGILIYNDDASIVVYVGGPTVDTSNGIPIAAGGSLSLDVVSAEQVWAVAASGTPVIRILTSHQ